MENRAKFEELVGTRIGDYIIDSFVGSGGQAVVFCAHSQTLGGSGKYALKVFGLLESVRDGLEAGLDDAKKQSRVDHPAVVKVLTPGIEDDVEFDGGLRRVLFLPMAFSALGSCESEAPFAGRQLTEVDFKAMLNLLDGLNAIHDSGLTHNDIKPANILKFRERIEGEDRTILRITDFGIAKVLDAIGVDAHGPSGFTTHFMAPEQVDHRYSYLGDIYSMGGTLYHMVTGKYPITSDDEWNLLSWQQAHKSHPRPNAHAVNPFCPPRLALLIMRMMSVEPSDRPEIPECIEELRSILAWLHGQMFEFTIPARLQAVLESDAFPLYYHPEFRGIFKPEVHSACGSTLFVLRLKMRHPVLEQYKRLIRSVAKQFTDSFCMYETWGTYDINMFLWSNYTEIEKLRSNLKEQFPRSDPQVAAASRVHHFHDSDHTVLESPSPVLALAVQERIALPGLEQMTYQCGSFPAEAPDRSVRAFTYVEAASEEINESLFRKAITEHVRQSLLDMWRRRPGDFRRMSLIELAPPPDFPSHHTEHSSHHDGATAYQKFSSTAVIVDFVAAEYKHLPEVPTTIIETLGESAVRTITCLETRRIMIHSDTILL